MLFSFYSVFPNIPFTTGDWFLRMDILSSLEMALSQAWLMDGKLFPCGLNEPHLEDQLCQSCSNYFVCSWQTIPTSWYSATVSVTHPAAKFFFPGQDLASYLSFGQFLFMARQPCIEWVNKSQFGSIRVFSLLSFPQHPLVENGIRLFTPWRRWCGWRKKRRTRRWPEIIWH